MARQRKSDAAELTAADELVMDSPLADPAAPATTPGGMVRINKGDQQRCIWPVHLSGWQQLGWTVLGGQGAEPQLAGRRNTKPEPLIEPLSSIDGLDPLHPPLDPDQDLDPLAWDDTTAEQP